MLFRLSFLLLFLPVVAAAQDEESEEEDYYEDNYLRFSDFIYKDNIKTVEFELREVNVSLPIIMLNSDQQLRLSFDDLDGGYKSYSYTVFHCDRDWNQSDIPFMDYVDGYNEDLIYNEDYSFNTNQVYTHYSFVFPRETMQLKISGNYILYVFEDGDRDNPVITRRFRVFEQLVSINAEVRRPAVAAERYSHHSLKVVVNYDDYQLQNPLRNVSLYAYQNQRWDNSYENLKPVFLRENELVYDQMDGIVFNGGNEFRWLDIRSLRYQPENIDRIYQDRDSSMTHVFMLPDIERRSQRYRTETDLDGRFDISIQEGNDGRVESDYAMVHFKLASDTMIDSASVYLFGGLTDWRYQSRYRMDYNRRGNAYELSAYVKQGYYNYQYMVVPDKLESRTREKGGIGQTFEFEGDFYQTEQIYTLFLYESPMGARYDRLIGFAKVNSSQLN